MNRFAKFAVWLNRAMAGRHGSDPFSVALLVLYCILLALSDILRLPILFYVAFLALCFSIYRMMSRRQEQRWKENAWFLKWWRPVSQGVLTGFRKLRGWFQNRRMRFMDRKTFRYFRCPKCKNTLRVPKKRGKIIITCPVCRTEFTKKT